MRPAVLLSFVLWAFSSGQLYAQNVNVVLKQMSTPERVRKNIWWPTKSLDATAGYVGPSVCAQCHVPIAKSQRTTAMANTLMPVGQSAIFGSGPRSFELGAFRYSVARADKDLIMAVTDGARQLSVTLQWAFGSGTVGQSYIWEQNGTLTETRFNYFGKTGTFDWAPGRLHAPPQSLEMAVGRSIQPSEAGGCLRCHSTGVPPDLSMSKLIAGITCEACHGPGAEHVAAQKSGIDAAVPIFNPARLSQPDATDFCGACHSSYWDVELTGQSGIATVRSPGYRLQKSKCWTTDSTLTCTTCHDPHRPVSHESSSYDSECEQCHDNRIKKQGGKRAPSCKVATSQRATCHMVQYELPEMHSKFTDHNIRVPRGSDFVE